MAKKNDKANEKAEELPVFMVGVLPVKHRKLTPERASEWLESDYGGLQDLVNMGLANAQEKADREALEWLGYNVARMVEACTTAIRSRKPVHLRSDLDLTKKDEPCFFVLSNAVRLLNLPAVLGNCQIERLQGETLEAFGQISYGVHRYVDEGVKRHRDLWMSARV